MSTSLSRPCPKRGLDPFRDTGLTAAGGALAPINGAEPLAAGEHALTATYRVEQPGVWSGSISAGPVRVLVP